MGYQPPVHDRNKQRYTALTYLQDTTLAGITPAPPKPALYSGFSMGMAKADQFGEAWDRDPNRMNTHLQVMWDDLVGEPEGVRSLDCTWNCSRACFQGTLGCCYTLLTIIYAPIFALLAGLNFACLSFTHIWAYGPCLRSCKINCSFYRKVTQVVLAATLAPFCETIGLLFSKAKVRRYQIEGPAEEDNPEQIFIA